MEIQTFIIDAFTDEPFKGNPAGVCLLEHPIHVELMQSIANELNLSETAFIMPEKSDETKYYIRYFTPTVEIAFCGHATLASSALLLERMNKPKVEFRTHFNLILKAVAKEGSIVMTFPLYDTDSYEVTNWFLEAVGINNPINTRYNSNTKQILIEISSKEELEKLSPDFIKLAASPDTCNALIVTAKSADDTFDFYSRCFAPWVGINEDPVTGAAHTVLAKYWADKLQKTEMQAYQASKRGGYMKLKILGNAELEVTSKAQIVFEGKLIVNN